MTAADTSVDQAGAKSATRFIFLTVLIDAIGIGLIMPVLPELIGAVGELSVAEAALWGGYLTLSYAMMQFLFAPTVGNLSDRFGRRPVLLITVAALGIDYLIMALAPELWVLVVGRLIAGLAGATQATASAVVTDISSPETRAQKFGLVQAAFGAGFVIGPLIGGVAGEFGARVPFFLAAAVCAANFVYGFLVMPETLAERNRRSFSWRRANPLGVARQITLLPAVAWLVVCFFLFQFAFYVYPAVWAYFGPVALGWSPAEVGISLAFVGVGFVVAQGWLIRIVIPRFGPTWTAVAGLITGAVGLAGLSVSTEGWMIYVLMPLTTTGMLCLPALKSLMSTRLEDNAQGELQGVLASVTGITMILSPLIMTQTFAAFADPGAAVFMPGAPFLLAALLMALAVLPLMIGLRRD